MTLKEEMEKILGLKKMQKVSVERLHPPMAPKVINRVELSVREDHYKPIVSETSVEQAELKKEKSAHTEVPQGRTLTDSKLAIDYHRIADLATFERFLIEAIKIIIPGFQGVPTRVSKQKMTKVFNERVANYQGVMNEYKDKVAKLQEKRAE